MAEITEETVKHLAELARIALSPEEIPALQKDLNKILEYVDALKAVNTDGLPEISQVTGLKNVLREDTQKPIDADIYERLVKIMPATENGYLKVKAVFEDTEE